MRETIDAIYENGVLRPLHKLSMTEGQRIRIVLERASKDEPSDADESESEWLRAVSRNPAFAFLSDPEEDIYTFEDGAPLDD
ncbi:MAG: antitoxin family protein [Proteobacteria bacterium]|nr:antitoxin family protein [Pseudomonadota bacterium]